MSFILDSLKRSSETYPLISLLNLQHSLGSGMDRLITEVPLSLIAK